MADRLDPDYNRILTTLGVARYRTGLVQEAFAALSRSNQLNQGKEPPTLAVLAMASWRLGQASEARALLGQLRELLNNSPQVNQALAEERA